MSSVLRNFVRNSSLWRSEAGVRISVNGVRGITSQAQQVTESPSPPVAGKKGQESAEASSTTGAISKAMKSYLERAEEHRVFMQEQENDFVFGRRHLANMMGKDPETFSQKDIDEAIRYLFPSGLFEPKARPIMRPPNEIFPKQKAAQFDVSGRPHHPFFYTTKPNFFFLVHEVMGKLNELNSRVWSSTPEATSNSLDGTIWISKDELEGRLLEHITDSQYEEWTNCMQRLVDHPNNAKEIPFLKSYRKALSHQNVRQTLPPVLLQPDGRQSVKVEVCQKKTSLASVTVVMPGTGNFDINGQDLSYFESIRAREAVIYPLQLVDWLGTVDVVATVTTMSMHRGYISEAAAVRFGIATGIAALGADVETLRYAGLLTKNWRKNERNRIGCDGARDRWTWKKR